MKRPSVGESSPLLMVAALLVAAGWPTAAHAYVDPGTGSFVIQGIIAAVVGAGFALKVFWHRIVNGLTGRKPDLDDDDE